MSEPVVTGVSTPDARSLAPLQVGHHFASDLLDCRLTELYTERNLNGESRYPAHVSGISEITMHLYVTQTATAWFNRICSMFCIIRQGLGSQRQGQGLTLQGLRQGLKT